MDTVTKKTFRTLPWENHLVAQDPWHLHTWFPNVDHGVFQLVDRDMAREDNPETGRKEWVIGEEKNRFRTFVPERVTRDEMARIFQISATEDITLMEAFIESREEGELPQKWIDKALAAPKRYADPKYATKVPSKRQAERMAAFEEEPDDVSASPKRGRGRPRKDAAQE